VVKREIEVTYGNKNGVAERLPMRVGRRAAAAIVSERYFPVSYRTLERWPLNWRRINGRAVANTDELLAEAQRRVDDAPVIRGGH
jgi:hypothetical protein